MKLFLFCLALVSAMSSLPAFASVTIVDANDWKVDFSGFLEMDTIHDDTRSGFTEVMGNSAVAKSSSAIHGDRMMFSMRNTRLAFKVQAPTYDGWKSRGYFEMDFLGYDPSPGASNSESAFYNNPTFRVRHAYLSTEKAGWQVLAGQTWALFGWQPYYFMPTLQVSPIAGMLYSRTAQVRGVKTMELSDDQKLQLAVGVMRPPQRDAGLPAAEVGARWSMDSWSGAFTGGATGSHKPQPLSVGISGTVRQFEVPNDPTVGNSSGVTHKMGSALAVDTLIPILASLDGKSSSNNLVFGAEYSIGQGDGDQFSGWSGGQKNPIMQTAGDSQINLDGGIGGYDAANNFGLMKVQTWNVYLQYHLPESLSSWISVGYGQLDSSNVANFITTNSNLASAAAYYKDQIYFANFAHDFTKQIRAGVEYAHMTTNYVDGTLATDNRFQVSGWFIF